MQLFMQALQDGREYYSQNVITHTKQLYICNQNPNVWILTSPGWQGSFIGFLFQLKSILEENMIQGSSPITERRDKCHEQ